eukprot:COSAG01_NODE_22750_length_842_cov_3.574920_1_plen_36_part_10
MHITTSIFVEGERAVAERAETAGGSEDDVRWRRERA